MAETIPLSALIPDKLDSVSEQVRARLCDNEEIGRMKLAWDFIGKELNGALKSALDADLLDILGGVWAQAAPIVALADPARHPPGERSIVDLGGHDLTRDLHPVVAVTIGPCPCVEISLLFSLAAHIGSARLAIADGHIVGGDLGELWASAQLSYEGIPLHPAQESAKVRVPGEVAFAAPGIKIPRIPSVAVEGAAGGG